MNLRTWLDENSFTLTDYGSGTCKLSCGLCGPILRDVPIDVIARYARTHPANSCTDLAEWEALWKN